jgi:hypothetical protein
MIKRNAIKRDQPAAKFPELRENQTFECFSDCSSFDLSPQHLVLIIIVIQMIPSTANSAYQAQQPKDGRRYVARPQYEQPHLPPTRPTASESVQTLAVPVADTQAVNVQTQPAIASTQDDDQFQQLVELEGELFPVPAVRGVEDKSQVQQSETITIGTSATGTSLARSIWDEMQEHCKSCKGGYKVRSSRI